MEYYTIHFVNGDIISVSIVDFEVLRKKSTNFIEVNPINSGETYYINQDNIFYFSIEKDTTK
jgi:hypothetical protein